jgi:HK97 family phage major capsid protein
MPEIKLEDVQKALQDKIDTLKKDISEGMVDKKEFGTKLDEINTQVKDMGTASDKLADEMKTSINNLNEKLEEMKQNRQKAERFVDTVIKEAGLLAKEYKEKGHRVAKDLELKTAIEMGISTAITGAIPEYDREAGISYEPKRRPLLLDSILTGTTTSNTVAWVEKTDEAGAPAFKKEFGTFPSRSWKSTLRTALVKKIAVMAEYSTEILEDVSYFQAELRRDLVEQIQIKLDDEILNGDEGGAEEAGMKGILDYAQAWTNGTFTVASPSVYDAIAVGVNQVRKEHHNPTVILMSPTTAMKMKLTKDKNENYVMPPFAAANGVQVEGMPVLTNTLFDDDEILIMDGTKAQFLWKRNWTLEVSDSHDTNFAKDVIAVRLSGRGVLKIKNTDAKAFVHIADVNDAITSLTPSS